MKAFSDPVFLLFLGFVIIAVIYGSIIVYIVFKDRGGNIHRHKTV